MICSLFACFSKMEFEKCWWNCWKLSLRDLLADNSYSMCQGEGLWRGSMWTTVCMVLCSPIWLTAFEGSTCHAQSSPVFLLFPHSSPWKVVRHFKNILFWSFFQWQSRNLLTFGAVERLCLPLGAEYITYTWTLCLVFHYHCDEKTWTQMWHRSDLYFTVQNALTITRQNKWCCNCLWLQRHFIQAEFEIERGKKLSGYVIHDYLKWLYIVLFCPPLLGTSQKYVLRNTCNFF